MSCRRRAIRLLGISVFHFWLFTFHFLRVSPTVSVFHCKRCSPPPGTWSGEWFSPRVTLTPFAHPRLSMVHPLRGCLRMSLLFANPFIIHYPLSTIRYSLSIIHYPLSIIRYPLTIIHYPLSIVKVILRLLSSRSRGFRFLRPVRGLLFSLFSRPSARGRCRASGSRAGVGSG